jgi:hypothetical protein
VERKMRKRKITFKELVLNNKQQLKEDLKEIEKIEVRIEDRYTKK